MATRASIWTTLADLEARVKATKVARTKAFVRTTAVMGYENPAEFRRTKPAETIKSPAAAILFSSAHRTFLAIPEVFFFWKEVKDKFVQSRTNKLKKGK